MTTATALDGIAGGGRTAGVAAVRRLGAVIAVAILGTLLLPVRSAAAEVTFNQRVFELVNKERSARGLGAMVVDSTLAATAEDAPYSGCGFTVYGRAKDMGDRNYFSHTILGCATQSVFNILTSTGLVYSGSGENVGWMNGTTDPLVAAENLFSQWMNSSGHRDNILNPNFTRIGIGSWHTAPGATWSGGGFALPNVYIGVQIFAGGAVTTTTTTAPPATTTTVAPTTTTTPPAATGRYTPLTPARILDTRDGTGGLGVLIPGATADMQITGRGGIPTTDVSAVAMTVTVTQPSVGGYVTLYPAGIARPLAANLTFVAGETVSNLVVVKVGANGKVSLFNALGTTHVVADVAGWYSSSGTGNAGRFESVVPARILDTRNGTGGGVRLGPGASLDMQVTGRGGIPASGVQAVSMNVTVTETTAPGYLTIHPTGEVRPLAATLTYDANATVGSRTMVKLGTGGKVTIFNGGQYTDVIVDVGGWFTDSSVAGTLGALTALNPTRILDTRDGLGFLGPLLNSGSSDVQVTGRGGVPSSGVRAVVMNVTVTQPVGPGYLTISPAGATRPLASDLNYAAGETQANLVLVQLGTGGKVSLFSSAGSHVIFDVAGWIS